MKIILKCYNDGNQIKLKKGYYGLYYSCCGLFCNTRFSCNKKIDIEYEIMEKYHRKQLKIGESFSCEGFYITIQDITSDYIDAYIYKRE